MRFCKRIQSHPSIHPWDPTELTSPPSILFAYQMIPQGSVWKVLPRSIQILLKKEDGDNGFWERLLKDKQLEKTNVKVHRHLLALDGCLL